MSAPATPATAPTAPAASTGTPAPVAVTAGPAGALAAGTPSSTTTTGPTGPTGPAQQVLPELTRLVSRGDGVHRVTLQLNPRALGDVRVVLTMRQGDVHVRLSAGPEARAALASSSSELSRALDRLGLGEHRISLGGHGPQDASVVVARGGATDAWPGTGQDGASSADHGNEQGHGRHHAEGRDTPQTDARTAGDPSRNGTAGGPRSEQQGQHHHSRTGDDNTARDGLTDGPGARPRGVAARIPTTDRPARPGTVDLRM